MNNREDDAEETFIKLNTLKNKTHKRKILSNKKNIVNKTVLSNSICDMNPNEEEGKVRGTDELGENNDR